jgi:hypothetical protein
MKANESGGRLMTTTKTGGVKVNLTLPAETYGLLEEMCRMERRNNKSR